MNYFKNVILMFAMLPMAASAVNTEIFVGAGAEYTFMHEKSTVQKLDNAKVGSAYVRLENTLLEGLKLNNKFELQTGIKDVLKMNKNTDKNFILENEACYKISKPLEIKARWEHNTSSPFTLDKDAVKITLEYKIF
jgi:hypothetical protein